MIKVTSEPNVIEEAPPTFPAFFRSKEPGLVVLFFSEGYGMIISASHDDSRFSVGEVKHWSSCFGPFWERLPKGTKFTIEQG